MAKKKAVPIKKRASVSKRALPDKKTVKVIPQQKKPSELRKRAEKKLKSQITPPKIMSDKETKQLIHELQVHQIELEMQNEELRKAQSELEESRTRYSDLYDFAPVGYFTFDKHGLILEVNLIAAKELGVERSLLINKPFRAYIVTKDRAIFDSHLQKVFKSDARQTCEIRLKRKDGIEFYAQLESIAANDLKGNSLCRTSVSGITERKRLEDILKKERQELKLIIDSSPIIVFYKDKEGKFIRVNKAFAEVLKMSEEEFIGKTVFDLYSAQIAQGMTNDDHEVFKSGRPKLNIIEQYESPSGIRWVQTDKIPICDKNGIPVGLIGFAQDITERKRADAMMKMRLDLLEYAGTHSFEELLQKTLDEIGALTDSPIGFYHFVDPDQKTLSLQAWSTRTVKEFCTAKGKGMHYGIDQAGVWVDCVHQRRPVIHNDYLSLPHRKGLPEGHAAVIRELVVPIIHKDNIVAILGIGNKPTDYTEKDVELVSFIADVAWEITKRKRAEEELKHSEEHFRALIENSSDIIVILNHDGIVKYLSPSVERTLGYKPDDLLDKNAFEFIHHDDVPETMSAFTLAIQNPDNTYSAEFRFPHKDGSWRFLEAKGKSFLETSGMQVVVNCRDITEHRLTEEKIRASEEKFRIIFDSANDGILLADTESKKFYFANITICRMLGYSQEEIKNIGVMDIHPEKDIPYVIEQFEKLSRKEMEVVRDLPMKRKDGSVFYADVNSAPVEISGKRYLLGIFRDITERRKNEEKIRTLEGRVKHIVDNSLVGVFESSTKGEILFFNEPLLRILEFESREDLNLRGGAYVLYKNPGDREKLLDLIVEKGHVEDYELEFVTKTGRPIHILVSMRMENDILSGTVVDITERKKAEEALRASEARFATVFRVSPICTSLTRLSDGQFFDVNEEFLRLFGYDRREVIGSNPLALNMWVRPEDRTRMLQSMHTSGRAEGFETLFRTKSGEIRNMLVVADLIDIAGERYILGLSHDITKQKKAEQAIAELRRHNELILNSTAEGIIGLDSQGNHTFVNPSAAGMLGYEVEELMGQHSHPIWHHSMDNGSTSPEDECPIYATLKDGAVRHNVRDEVFWRKDGTSFPVAYSNNPIMDEGKIIGAVVNFRDITERKKAEEALRASEQYVKRIVDTSPNLLYIYDLLEHRNVFACHEILRILGYKPEDVQKMGSSLFDTILHPDDRDKVAEHHKRLAMADDGVVNEIEYRMRHVTGIWRWLLSRDTVFLRGSNGIAKQILGVAQDMTESKSTQEQIKRQVDHLAALRDIDKAITSSFDLRLTLRVLLDEVVKQLRVDAADVLLFNHHLQTLEYAAGLGFRTTVLQHTRLPLGKGHAGQAAIKQKIICIPNLPETPGNLARAPLFAKEEFVSYYAAPLITKGQIKGVLEIFHRSRLEADAEWFDFLDALSTQAAIAIDNAELFNSLQRSNIELIMAYDATIEGWAHALDYRDKETEGHSRRVTEMTVTIAKAIRISDAEIVHVRRGALLHDIGKMGIPDSILLKPGKLTEEEWEIMRKHPVYAYDLLSPIDFLRPALDIPYCHHEKWDGTGYPRGLKGEEIPLSARIFSGVDVWDALCSDRPYRPAWSKEKALEYMQQQTGKDFDPRVIEFFLKVLSEG